MSGHPPSAMRFMPSELLRNALSDIRDNILFAQEFVAELDYVSFVKSRRDVYAVTRAIEIVPETSRKLPDDVRARNPSMHGATSGMSAISIATNTTMWRNRTSGGPVQEPLPPLLEVVLAEISILDAGS